MPTRTSRNSSAIVRQATGLAMAVPQVVAHRLTRMAMAGSTLSARDRKEFDLMLAEKNAAFTQAWQAMAMQSMRANQALAASLFSSAWSSALRGKMPTLSAAAQLQNAALGILNKGLAPVHRKAVANAKRLARTNLR